MAEKTVNAGEFLFREGDVADVAYIVLSGKIALSESNDGHETDAGTVEAGRAFGELALFDAQTLRQHTAHALEDTVVSTVSPEEFNASLSQCPKQLQPFLVLAFEKMKATRTKGKTYVKAVLDTDVKKLVIAPASNNLKEQLKPIEVPIARLPFRIGGFPEGGESSRRDQLHLSISARSNPLRVSRQHCEIVIENNKLVVTDLGSRFCTVVNDTIIGRGHGKYHAPLQKGKNEITLGITDDPYKITVTCE
jgi:CRP-like cAMP-binding protein